MEIKVYCEKGNFNYIVKLGDSIFEMSNDADAPNGVNMYCGESLQLNPKDLIECSLGDLQKSVLIAIIHRLNQHISIITETNE